MRQNSFTIIGLATVVFCVIAIVSIFLAFTQHSKRKAERIDDGMQLRGIHRGLVTFSNANKNWYPGIDSAGKNEAIEVHQRFQLLIASEFITPEYAIHPKEFYVKSTWDDESVPMTTDNYSYAMLQVPEEGGRRSEWNQTLNSQAIVVSDRNTGSRDKPTSIHTEPGGTWHGGVLWNDNHVAFELIDEFETKYGNGTLNQVDRLFQSDGLYDALMLHSGNAKD